MAVPVCEAAMQTMNLLFLTPYIFNDGHEIMARLRAGDSVADIASSIGRQFGPAGMDASIVKLAERWPPSHLEAVGQVVGWALGKLDSDDRITITWKGDADAEETLTRFELRGNELVIEFAHPPAMFAGVGRNRAIAG